MGRRLTKAQREMLQRAADIDGAVMHDGVQANVASRLAAKGLVTLPHGHGFVYGATLLRVRITEAGRRSLASGTEGDRE